MCSFIHFAFVSFGTQLFDDFFANEKTTELKHTLAFFFLLYREREDLLAISQIFTFHNPISRQRFFHY